MKLEFPSDWSRYRHSVHYLEALLSLEPERRVARPLHSALDNALENALHDASGEKATTGAGGVGLWRCQRLLAFLGHPERAFECVHVTGTSGKGSTVIHLHRLLHAHGRRVGSYFSPHISTPLERIMLGDRLIPLEAWLEGLEKLKPFVQAEYRTGPYGLPSFHELLFALALETFRAHGVEVALIEVGIGGRLDSTNLIPPPLLAIVTEVGLDHQELLGPDIPTIARDKAGIFKPGSLALTGTLRPEAEVELSAEAQRVGIPLWSLGEARETSESLGESPRGDILQGESSSFPERLQLVRTEAGWVLESPLGRCLLPESGLAGVHQQRNAALALVAAQVVAERLSFGLEPERVALALGDVFLPGRLEQVVPSPGQRLLLDMAHNLDKLEGLCRYWEGLEGVGGAAVVAVASDKDVEGMLLRLSQTFAHLYLTRPLAVPRKLFGPWALLERARALGISASAWIDPREALRAAWQAHEGRVVVTGSTYLVGELRTWLMPEAEVVAAGRLERLSPERVQGVLSLGELPRS